MFINILTSILLALLIVPGVAISTYLIGYANRDEIIKKNILDRVLLSIPILNLVYGYNIIKKHI